MKNKNLLKGFLVAITAGMLAISATASAETLEQTDVFEQQNGVDEALIQEMGNGYTLEEPLVILNPYGTSPLTAVVIFDTEEETGGTITVKGKSAENDINGTFESAKNHLIPVYGLYNGDTTEVEITLDNGDCKTLEITTEAMEIQPGEIKVEMLDDSAYDYSELTIVCSTGGSLCALDSAGDIRWYYAEGGTLGVHQLANGHLMVPSKFLLKQSYYKSGLTEIDLSGKIYREYAIPGGMHHDFQELPNGNLLVASDSPDLTCVEDYVVEIDRATGEVVWELDMRDVMDIDDGASASIESDGSESVDWFHNNSLWYDEENDLVLLSARHKDAIVAVHKEDKTLAWILGDPEGWEKKSEEYFFTPVGDNFEWQYAQHQVTMLDNGDIMMFDNGTAKVKAVNAEERVTGDDVYSRAVIYHIDTENMTVEQVFEYGKERGPQWYSDWISGVESLDGTQDNLWITAGSNLYNSEEDSHDYGPAGMFIPGLIKSTHIDHVVNGELAFEIIISGENYQALTFRSLRMPLYTGADLDVQAVPEVLGSLGVTVAEDVSQYVEGQEEETDMTGWSVQRDDVKISVSGTYVTENTPDTLQDAWLVLKTDGQLNGYKLVQNASEKEGETSVLASGWVSLEGLEDQRSEICLLLDGIMYNTGFELE
ncbi:MAG: aryl-sulfate sulfotransferase [Eubacteriales bacterium]|nr:aryl-sulfate sulfotransferase [Eubacteriales bacterium]